jgi:hypothetical protein
VHTLAGQEKKSTPTSPATWAALGKNLQIPTQAQKRCCERVDGDRSSRHSETNAFHRISPVSRLGRIAVSTSTTAFAVRAMTPATLISTTTGMTTTGPLRAGTG